MVIYVVADVGSIAGGWLSSWMIHRGRSVNARGRRRCCFARCAWFQLCSPTALIVLWGAVSLIALAAAAHEGFSANLFTLPSDMFPARAIASVVGIGGMAGAVGGMLIAKIVGYALQWTGSYMIPFLIAAFAYLLALAAIQLLSPKLEPVSIR